MLVAPTMVSGLSVAVTKILSPIGNFKRVSSLTPTPSPSSRSWSPTGLSQFGQYFTGCSPFATNPFSYNVVICHLRSILQ